MEARKKIGPKKFIAFIVVGVFVLLLAYVLLTTQRINTIDTHPQSTLFTERAKNALTPTPIPFAEMTIPHLRSRTYTSSLGKLDKLNEYPQYTSYLTHYDSDGLTINGLLTVPRGSKPARGWPAIVFVHGYIPPTQYETERNYATYVDYLGRNGFVVFKIDLRGHDESEGEASGAYYSSDYVIDVLNAKAALASSDFVNPTGIGLWGHSMAGNVILRALAAEPTIPAITIWAGAVYSYEDFQRYRINDNSYRRPSAASSRQRRRDELFTTYGEFDPKSSFWRQVVATNYLADIRGAIELHHAVDDVVVNIGYSRDLMAQLDETSIAHALFEYQSGGHNLSGTSFTLAMQRTVAFFQKYLSRSVGD